MRSDLSPTDVPRPGRSRRRPITEVEVDSLMASLSSQPPPAPMIDLSVSPAMVPSDELTLQPDLDPPTAGEISYSV